MMDFLAAVLVVVLFVVLLDVLKLVEQARAAIFVSRKSMETMRNPELDDDTKERELQKGALSMFRLMVILLVGFAIALAAPMGVVWLLDRAGLMSFDGVAAMLIRWDFMLGATVLGVGTYIALNKRRQ